MNYQYKHRSLSKHLTHLFAHFPCIILVGARQVGKSTLLTHLFPQATHILLDPIQDVQNIRRDPDLFLNNCKMPVIFDEVQYAPELIPALKRSIDNDRCTQYHRIPQKLSSTKYTKRINCCTSRKNVSSH